MNTNVENEIVSILKKSKLQNQPSEQFISSFENRFFNGRLLNMGRRKNYRIRIIFSSILACGISALLLAPIVSTLDVLKSNSSSGYISTVNMDNAPKVFIYQTHNYESFSSDLDNKDSEFMNSDSNNNIEKVGQYFANSLNKKGITAIQDRTDISKQIEKNNDSFTQSYVYTRKILQEALAKYDDLEYVFDIHRDSITRDKTTTKINDQTSARILFVLSKDNPNYIENLRLAEKLVKKLEKDYPGVSRGIQTNARGNTYNQDLSTKALLIEVGGTYNSLREEQKAMDILADVVSKTIAQ
jgi:stage II sporulation protein P